MKNRNVEENGDWVVREYLKNTYIYFTFILNVNGLRDTLDYKEYYSGLKLLIKFNYFKFKRKG